MTIETYPYPEQEHFDEPTDAHGVIREEMRLYKSPADFRKCLAVLHQIYSASPLYLCMEFHAETMADVQHKSRKTLEAEMRDVNFLDGAVLALHSICRPLQSPVRKYILSQDAIGDRLKGETSFDTVEAEIFEDLSEYEEQRWLDFFNDQEPELQDLLIDVSTHAYDDLPHSEDKQQRMIAGYLYAANHIMHAAGASAPTANNT